jgi:hypothetical protein
MLGITSEQIVRAFPGHAYDYIRDNFNTSSSEDYDDDAESEIGIIERLRDEGYTILDEDSER